MRIPTLLVTAVVLGLGPAVAVADDHVFKVCTVPLGPYDEPLLTVAERGIRYLYGFEVDRLAARRLPAAAFYRPRQRYRAEKLLAYLDAKVVPGAGCDRVMGFTRVDISTTKGAIDDWGILGLATIGGPSGVVSTHRVKHRAAAKLQAMRTVKVMNHELGHALGLEHHAVAGCIMEDAAGTVKTVDGETGLLCDESRQEVDDKNHLTLPALTTFDWSQVL